MKNRGVVVLAGLVAILGLYAYFGEYRREIQQTEKKETDSKIISLKRDQVQKIILDKGNEKRIVLEKTTDGWNLTEPLKDQADNDNAEAFLDQITGEKAVDVIEVSEDTKWDQYGLQSPLGTVKLVTNTESSQTIVVSPRKNFEGLVFVRREQEAKVLTSSAVWIDFLSKNVDFYRNLKIFRPLISKVDYIKVKNEKDTFELRYQNEQWQSVLHPEWKMDQNAIREILTQVSSVKGTGLTEKKPSGSPKLRLEFRMGSEKWSGDLYKDVVVAQPPGFNISVGPQTLEKFLTLDLLQLRDKTGPFKFEKDLVEKIRVKTALKSFVLIRKGEGWELEKPDDQVVVNSSTADELVEKLRRLEVYRYLAKVPALPPMFSEIQLLDEKGNLVFQLNWSDFVDHAAYSKTNVFSEVFQIDDAQVNRLLLTEIVKPKPKPGANPETKADGQESK
ncbi:MAG: DUF4340 domain-containing protein [Bdellovibrionales bacterium]